MLWKVCFSHREVKKVAVRAKMLSSGLFVETGGRPIECVERGQVQAIHELCSLAVLLQLVKGTWHLFGLQETPPTLTIGGVFRPPSRLSELWVSFILNTCWDRKYFQGWTVLISGWDHQPANNDKKACYSLWKLGLSVGLFLTSSYNLN